MKNTNDEIEEPVRKSPWLLAGGVVILLGLLYLGIWLLVEALKTPEGPQDVLDMKRMATSGIGVILFAVAVLFFLIRTFKTEGAKPKKTSKTVKRKPAKRKPATRKKK